MKINKIEIIDLALPMVHSFETSFGVVKDKHTIIIKAIDDKGQVGFGESSVFQWPSYTYETTDTCFMVLEKYIAPLILSESFSTISEFVALYDSVRGHNFAKAGLEFAVWHLTAIDKKLSLKALIGGVKNQIPVGESIGIKASMEDLLSEVKQRINEGYRRTKVKIKPGWDLEVVKAIRAEFGNIDLMVDANSAYSLGDISLFKSLDQYNLTMIEQPLAHDDIVDHAKLQKQIKTPICLDESITSVEDARKAISIGACKIINIKPPRVGGLLEVKQIHDLAVKNNIGLWCGGMLETGIGRGFNIAAASLAGYNYPADMSPSSFYYKEDIIEPTYVVDSEGYVNVPNTVGLGYNVREDRIKKYSQNYIEINNKSKKKV